MKKELIQSELETTVKKVLDKHVKACEIDYVEIQSTPKGISDFILVIRGNWVVKEK